MTVLISSRAASSTACVQRRSLTRSTSGSMAAGVSSLNGACSVKRFAAARQRAKSSLTSSKPSSMLRAVQNCASSTPRPNACAQAQASAPMDDRYTCSLSILHPLYATVYKSARQAAPSRPNRAFVRSAHGASGFGGNIRCRGQSDLSAHRRLHSDRLAGPFTPFPCRSRGGTAAN